jgi:hypothetical protein
MRKRLTFEEAANLNNFVEAPARLPNHADVNGNPVYKQFLRLTQIYEEDEVRKRQDDLRDLWARTYDQRLRSSFHAPAPPRPKQSPENIPAPPDLGMRGMGAPGDIPGRGQLGPTGRAAQLPPLPTTQAMPGDGDGETSELAGSEEFYSDAEAEFASLQERAGQQSAALQNILDTTQNQQIKDETERMLQVMNSFSDVAGQLSEAVAVAGDGVQRGLTNGLMELYNVARNRSMGEWGVGAATAALSVFPQLISGSAVESIVLGGMGGVALGLGAVTIAEALYRLGGFVSVIGRGPRTQAAISLAEKTLQMLRDAARSMITDAQLTDEEKLQLQRALEELERREAWRMRADQGEQQAIRVLRTMRERPLEQYPDPGDPEIEEVIDQPARRQRMLEGPAMQGGGGQLALEDREGNRMAMEDRRPEDRTLEVQMDFPVFGRINISEARRAELMEEMRRNERNPDPSRETTYLTNTDYRMDNGLTLRLHQAPSAMWLELRRPPMSASDAGISLGTVARLQNPSAASQQAIQRRVAVFELAQRLQPPTMEALAAINKTVEMESPPTPRVAAAGSGAPGTPATGTPSRSRLRPLRS